MPAPVTFIVSALVCRDDGFVRGAHWLSTPISLERLAWIPWYDRGPLERYLRGEAPPGSVYGMDRS